MSKIYVIRNNNDTFTRLYLSRSFAFPFFRFPVLFSSCDCRISAFIARNLIKIYMQPSINVINLHRRKFCNGRKEHFWFSDLLYRCTDILALQLLSKQHAIDHASSRHELRRKSSVVADAIFLHIYNVNDICIQ